jgi:hypothetical protein
MLLSLETAAGRNVVIFVADGLRRSSVNVLDAPTLLSVRQQGVDFENSHSLFPTFTTPNAAAIATGHYQGDTGDFSNTMFFGYLVLQGKPHGETLTPFLENDEVLADLDEHHESNYLNEETLLAFARQNGYNTAAIGKLGPTLIQDVSQGNHANTSTIPIPETVIIDDSTGRGGVPLNAKIVQALKDADLPITAPDRSNDAAPASQQNNGFAGDNTTPGTLSANWGQQKFFVDATTRVILPLFRQEGKPFVLVFWSRDPDGTQHFQGDSLNDLSPGINGPTSKAAVHNADNNLKQILEFIQADPNLAVNTDIFVTSDHGFATISKHELDDSRHHFTQSYAATFVYKDSSGRQEVNTGFLPPGFLAIDIAHYLGLPLFDPDQQITDNEQERYVRVDPTIAQKSPTESQRPSKGNGLIGGSGNVMPKTDAKVVVVANGGSDLIYVIDKEKPDIVRNLVSFLTEKEQDYISGVFLDDAFGSQPGTLPLSGIDLKGSTVVPTPSIVVNFRSFAVNSDNPVGSQVTISDTILQQGQGMHGSFGRGDTLNNMAAVGPDFKVGFVDRTPVSNADVPLTVAHILSFDLPSKGSRKGRVIKEALLHGPEKLGYTHSIIKSKPSGTGMRTILILQQVGNTRYYDAAGFVGRTVGLNTASANPSPETEPSRRKRTNFTARPARN